MAQIVNLSDQPTLVGSATLQNGEFLTFDALPSNKFSLVFPKLPDVTFFLQGFSFPNVSISPVNVPTRQVDYPQIGEKVKYQPIELTFLVDKYSRNWSSVFNWMKSMTVEGSAIGLTDNVTLMIDNKPFLLFYDAWPTSLTGYNLTSISETLVYVKATITLQYSFFEYLGQFATSDSTYD